MLQQHGVDDLCSLLLTDCVLEWNDKAPLLITVLRALLGPNISENRLAFMGSSLLFARNPTMSRVHYATGLILDRSGCTDQVRCVCECVHDCMLRRRGLCHVTLVGNCVVEQMPSMW